MTLIICNGMNRSGSTLQYNLVRGLLAQTGRGQAQGFILPEQLAEAAPQLAQWAAAADYHLVKMHDLPPQAAGWLAAGQLWVCYIYRDIRQVAASYRRVWQTPGDKLLAELDQAVANYDVVKRLPVPGRVLCQRYEQVTGDLATATQELATFLGLTPTPADVRHIVQECSPENMQRVVRRLEWKLRLQTMTGKATRRTLRLLRLRRLEARLKARALARRQAQSKRRIDDQTLLHPGHLGGADAAPALTPAELAAITDRYRAWLQEAGYPC